MAAFPLPDDPRKDHAVPLRRRSTGVPLLGLFSIALAACPSPTPSSDGGGAPPADGGTPISDGGTANIACGAELPGPGPVATSDGDPGYFDEVAALDLAGIDSEVDLSGLSPSQRTLTNFMLLRAGGSTVTASDIEAAGELGRAVAAAIAQGGGSEVDFAFLRRGLYNVYNCSRPLPPTLSDLRAQFGEYTAWEQRTVLCSRAKSADRRIFTEPTGAVFVAETLDEEGEVRETEVLFSTLRDDGHLDFAAYTGAGALTNRSTFATAVSEVVLAAPFACTACHIDSVGERLALVNATGTGSGCQ